MSRNNVHDESAVENVFGMLVGTAALVVLVACLVIVTPLYLGWRAIRRSACPRCRIPGAARTLSTSFDRENVKFNVDHYRVDCECRFCGYRWDYEKLGEPGMSVSQS